MNLIKSTLNTLPDQLNDAIRDVFTHAGMKVTHAIQPEAESAEYGACRFSLDGFAIAYRVAKTTPTKIGQFVIIWKRPTADGKIAPLDEADDVQFVVISVSDGLGRGQFIFSQTLLVAMGVMSRNGKGGKRAIRVYPPWTTPTAKDAIRAQQWQIQHFLPLASNGAVESSELVRKLFQG